MGYQIAGHINFPGKTAPVLTVDTKNVFVGFRAFARDERAGLYREIMEYGPDASGEYVQGEYQGTWSESTHETREGASRLAWKAYRYMNRSRAALSRAA